MTTSALIPFSLSKLNTDQNAAIRHLRHIFYIGLTFEVKLNFVVFSITGDRSQ